MKNLHLYQNSLNKKVTCIKGLGSLVFLNQDGSIAHGANTTKYDVKELRRLTDAECLKAILDYEKIYGIGSYIEDQSPKTINDSMFISDQDTSDYK